MFHRLVIVNINFLLEATSGGGRVRSDRADIQWGNAPDTQPHSPYIPWSSIRNNERHTPHYNQLKPEDN